MWGRGRGITWELWVKLSVVVHLGGVILSNFSWACNIIHSKVRVTIWRARARVMWVTIWYLTMNYLPFHGTCLITCKNYTKGLQG